MWAFILNKSGYNAILTLKKRPSEKIQRPSISYLTTEVLVGFFAAFAAFFSFGVKSGFFLVSFLLSWPLLMILSFLR